MAVSYRLTLRAEGLYDSLELLTILNIPDIQRGRKLIKMPAYGEHLFRKLLSLGIAAFGRKMTELGPHTFTLMWFLCDMCLSPFFALQKGKPQTAYLINTSKILSNREKKRSSIF